MRDQGGFDMLYRVPIQSFPLAKGARLQLAAALADAFAQLAVTRPLLTQPAGEHAQVMIVPESFGNVRLPDGAVFLKLTLNTVF